MVRIGLPLTPKKGQVMEEEKESEFFTKMLAKFPELLKDCAIMRRDPTWMERTKPTSYSPWQGWGWETPAGWNDLMEKLCEELHELAKPYYNTDNALQIAQVKSKFGGLRFYTDHVPKEIYEKVGALIQKYEKLCDEHSEVSGKPGASPTNIAGWVTTCTADEARQIQEDHEARIKKYEEERLAEEARLAARTPEQVAAEEKQRAEERARIDAECKAYYDKLADAAKARISKTEVAMPSQPDNTVPRNPGPVSVDILVG